MYALGRMLGQSCGLQVLLHLHSSALTTRQTIANPSVPDRLNAELVLLSAAQRRADLTVAVPLSADRLDRLGALCRQWGGPVSAAVYVATYAGGGPVIDDAMSSVQALFDRCSPELFHLPC